MSRQPACHCAPPTPWSERRYDGPWILDGEVIGYQRTCLTCGASKTSEWDCEAEDATVHDPHCPTCNDRDGAWCPTHGAMPQPIHT